MLCIIAMSNALFCFVELNLQHIMHMMDQVLVMSSMSTEAMLQPKYYQYTFFLTMFLLTNFVTFLPTTFSYRYQLVKDPINSRTWGFFIKQVSPALLSSALCGYLCAKAIICPTEAEAEHIISLIPPEMRVAQHLQIVYIVDFNQFNSKMSIWALWVVCLISTLTTIAYWIESHHRVVQNRLASGKTLKINTQFRIGLVPIFVTPSMKDVIPVEKTDEEMVEG
ncbi:unnamed protein product [Bursaphelenchus okinawaensis]|uniref:Uncharacterized protein n=1 Tax=Bursaphelenchus okinawaensis TaxID=465554 RepID=A0A811KP25_9BILA|nr:unnamed protein product [Bursaphelenchus okinawaensis]CAG9106688.1 unnamed protein product [Bursaphelenchus okinawaensis]